MSESLIWIAFAAGLVSACSLPLGALTSMVWRPTDRMLSFLMAFGGGALLAALTIDLVASALDRGHFTPLALGSIGGGLLFIFLNELVNDYGGFLRKASTTYYHLRQRDHVRFRNLLSKVQGIDFLATLDDSDYRELARVMYPLELEAGRTVFDRGDPSDALHIIQEGEIEIVFPDGGQLRTERAAPGMAMGKRAFLAGTPHSQKAVTKARTTMLVLPRREFLVLLENSSTLRQRVHLTIRAPDMAEYLVRRHGLSPETAEQRIADSAHQLYQHGRLADAVPVERHEDDFVDMAEKIQRLPFLHDLPESELNAIAGKLLYKRYPRGHALFHPGEVSERVYVVHEGEITLHSPRDSSRRGRVIEAGSAFGTFSFLTGGRHTMGAVAAEDSAVWELTRTDFQELLHEAPSLREALANVLQDDNIDNYLIQAQRLDRDRAGRWVGRALRNLGESRLSTVTDVQPRGVEMAHGAALAIWLGILLDGVPESFVIGASLVERGISLSLIAGLFLSNFPEALSSSAGMREQGFSRARILVMWTSLMLITGIGAALGNVLLTGASHATLSLVEGVAAGAMLTMIAQTMLPEAYFRGGNIVGFATLLGFLAAIFFSTLGPAH